MLTQLWVVELNTPESLSESYIQFKDLTLSFNGENGKSFCEKCKSNLLLIIIAKYINNLYNDLHFIDYIRFVFYKQNGKRNTNS